MRREPCWNSHLALFWKLISRSGSQKKCEKSTPGVPRVPRPNVAVRNNQYAATPFGETSSDTVPEPEDRGLTHLDDSRVGLATTTSQLPSAQQQEQERARRGSRGSLTTIVFAGERELNIHHAAAYASLVPEVSYGKQASCRWRAQDWFLRSWWWFTPLGSDAPRQCVAKIGSVQRNACALQMGFGIWA